MVFSLFSFFTLLWHSNEKFKFLDNQKTLITVFLKFGLFVTIIDPLGNYFYIPGDLALAHDKIIKIENFSGHMICLTSNHNRFEILLVINLKN